MDSSRDAHTNLLLMHGDEQASRQHAAWLKEKQEMREADERDQREM